MYGRVYHESGGVQDAEWPIFLSRLLEDFSPMVHQQQVGWLNQLEVQALVRCHHYHGTRTDYIAEMQRTKGLTQKQSGLMGSFK